MIDSVTEVRELSQKEHFEAVVRRYQGPLLRYARSRLGEHDAQDIVQEVFLRLHKALLANGLRDVARVGTWLFRVAHNCAADAIRRKHVDNKARKTIATDSVDEDCVNPGGLDEVVHREDCRLALGLLQKLPPRQKEVLVLKVAEGMTYRQICEVTGLPLGTVGYLMNQGLGKLAHELKSAGVI